MAENWPVKLEIGDVVQLRKKHPCGSDRWRVWRTGMDIGIECLGCGRKVMLPRPTLERRLVALNPPAPPPAVMPAGKASGHGRR